MAEITAAKIKELRDRTGVGMNKCKAALVEAGGDIENAIAALRKSGLAAAVKKQGRTTNEGIVLAVENAERVALVEINSETDFVAQNERFLEFARSIAEEAVTTAPADLESFLAQTYSKDGALTIDEYRTTAVQTIGENLQIRRVTTLPKEANSTTSIYSHMGGKIVVVVQIRGSDKEDGLARDVAMHIAAASPEYLDFSAIPQEIVNHEKEIAREQIKDKPENIQDKILEGKLRAFANQVCLLPQPYIRDDSVTVEQLVSKRGKELSIQGFARWQVGEKL